MSFLFITISINSLSGQVFINEIMTFSNMVYEDPDDPGDYPDWIELYNAGDSSVSLQDMFLTDNKNFLTKWQILYDTAIPAKSYLIIIADNQEQGALHANFRLSSKGGIVILADKDTIIVDTITYQKQYNRISYGRFPDGSSENKHFITPTPGTINSNPFAGIIENLTFEPSRGFYDGPINITITTPTPGVTIYYTLDGTIPDDSEQESTHKYTGPITVTTTSFIKAKAVLTNWKTTDPVTHSYIYLNDVIKQPATPDGFSQNWALSGKGDYEMDPDIVENPGYESTIVDDLQAIPSLSLVMDQDDWFGSGGQGIYIQGELVPKEVSAELIYPENINRTGFQENCNVMVFGGTSVNRWKTDKLSLKLELNSLYGSSKLFYPLFGKQYAEEFQTLILDARLAKTWPYGGTWDPNDQRKRAQYTRDQFTSDLQNVLGGTAPHGFHVHLYLNGLYWGLYCLHERPDEDFASEYFGGIPEDYDIMKHNKSWVVNGSNEKYLEMLQIADDNLKIVQNYARIKQMLDIENFINYIIVNHYVGNWDWAHQNWYASYNRVNPDGKWRFHSWDCEHLLDSLNKNVIYFDNLGGPTHIHQKLMENDEYKLLFMDQVQKHFAGNGTFTEENIKSYYQIRLHDVDRAVVGESARWGDSRRSTPYSRNFEWITERDRLLNEYFPQRNTVVLNQYRDIGWFPEIDAPIYKINNVNHYGGDIHEGDQLSIHSDNGTIYYTTNGTDPITLEIDTASGFITYFITDSSVKYVFVPHEDIGDDWRTNINYDITQWGMVKGLPGGIGYENDTGYEKFIGYDVGNEMHNDGENPNTSCYIRIPFNVDSSLLDSFNFMMLKIMFDDGFIAYLNGNEIASYGIWRDLEWNYYAIYQVEADQFITFDISENIENLLPGDNILTIQGANRSTGNNDFLILPELIAGSNTTSTILVSGDAMIYDIPLTINEATVIKSRTFYNNEWSALNEIDLTIFTDTSDIIISEILYNPLSDGNVDAKEFEFIEIKNIGDQPYDLSNVSFSKGISYNFPEDSTINPGEHIVIASNAFQFENRYGYKPYGEYSGALENTGEQIIIVDGFDTIYDIQYQNCLPWPDLTNIYGVSIVPKNPDTKFNYTKPFYWRASYEKNGSPGENDIDKHDTIIITIPIITKYNSTILMQNYPNPFNDYTFISYYLPHYSNVNLSVYNINGQKVAVLINQFENEGQKVIQWNGQGANGSSLPNGHYFYRLQTNNFIEVKKMVILR